MDFHLLYGPVERLDEALTSLSQAPRS